MNSFKIFCRNKVFSFLRRKETFYLDGELVFLDDSIVINEKMLIINSIESLYFRLFDDYIGKVTVNGGVSAGYGNVVDIVTTDGKNCIVHFQLTRRYQIRDIREQLIIYYKAGRLSFENLIDILGIEDYNAIQNFKKTLQIEK